MGLTFLWILIALFVAALSQEDPIGCKDTDDCPLYHWCSFNGNNVVGECKTALRKTISFNKCGVPDPKKKFKFLPSNKICQDKDVRKGLVAQRKDSNSMCQCEYYMNGCYCAEAFNMPCMPPGIVQDYILPLRCPSGFECALTKFKFIRSVYACVPRLLAPRRNCNNDFDCDFDEESKSWTKCEEDGLCKFHV